MIDGLGGLSDPYIEDEHITRISDRAWREILSSGVTGVRDTVDPVGNVAEPWGEYQKSIAAFQNYVDANPERLILVRAAADILRAKLEKKVGVILGTQDTSMVGPDLDRLAKMKADGVSIAQLTYNNRNLAGDGALEPANAGLSKLGKSTIERIEAEKLLLDLSHGGARTMAEAAAFAKRPLVISHTGARGLFDHPRNTDDPTVRAVADKGGVVGIYFMPFLVGSMKPTGGDLLDHIDHIARVAGEDHVGIGTDHAVHPTRLDEKERAVLRKWQADRAKAGIAAPGEGPDFIPIVEDYNSLDRFRRVGEDLMKRGWTTGRVEKLLGGNLLRVYRDAWGG